MFMHCGFCTSRPQALSIHLYDLGTQMLWLPSLLSCVDILYNLAPFDLWTRTCVEDFLYMSYCHTHSHTCSLTHTFIHTHTCTNTHVHHSHLYTSISHTHTHAHVHTHTHICTTQITHPSTKTFSRSLQEGELSPTSSSTGNQLADAMTSLPSTRADS